MKFLRIIFFLFLIFASYQVYLQFKAPEANAEKQRYVIKLKTSEEEVIKDLVSQGYLKSSKIFGLILDVKGWRGRIEPGSYMISRSMNAYELAKTLVFDAYQKWVLIPPGKRKEQVALILKKSLNWSTEAANNFIKVAQEGYLYPDTYLIETKADQEKVYQKLLNNFNQKFDKEIQKELLTSDIRNDTAIKIASLVERESGGAIDKPIIAGIIFNRLKKGMRLEIDATVQYAIATINLKEKNQNLDDFNFWPHLQGGMVRKIDSLYNTYLNDGLPPGPICSPSLEAIRAVANPSATKALYYLHSSDKIIHTAQTYQEHLRNIEKYLR